MDAIEDKRAIISRLKKDMLLWQGFRPPEIHQKRMGLGPVERAFPNGVFPTGSVHEFISMSREDAAASSGFIGSLLASLMQHGGVCLWISTAMVLFPPSVKAFGVEQPDRILFVRMNREKDALWAMEEALKCSGITAVIAELHGLDFMQSRRLQLAVEKSRVTGFVLRHHPHTIDATACTARWRIRPISSHLENGMPGMGFPRWEVELLKVRNGNPGKWQIEWSAEGFVPITGEARPRVPLQRDRKIG
ncbi:ImuA family protein [Olivibacter sp. XZL3]|uniref:ImuA family protein n=1 Tax=Olivibacter sp. XZL3 TaxID=1735116 RepID=UPI001066634E|nr:Error-prone repair protein ImuA [Olivibacter sp. XZL3]